MPILLRTGEYGQRLDNPATATEAISAARHERGLWTGLHGAGEAMGLIMRRDGAVLTACAAC